MGAQYITGQVLLLQPSPLNLNKCVFLLCAQGEFYGHISKIKCTETTQACYPEKQYVLQSLQLKSELLLCPCH